MSGNEMGFDNVWEKRRSEPYERSIFPSPFRQDLPLSPASLVFRGGGLGDNVLRLLCIPLLMERHKNLRPLRLWVPEFLLELAQAYLSQFDSFYPAIEIRSFKDFERFKLSKRFTISTDTGHYSSLREHIFTHAAVEILGEALGPGVLEENYPLEFRRKTLERFLPKDSKFKRLSFSRPFVVLTPMFTSETRKWNRESLEGFSRWLNESGFDVVLLGRDSTPTARTKIGIQSWPAAMPEEALNLINQTSLLETLEILSHARLVAGIDNGLLHLSQLLESPPDILWAFTNVGASKRVWKINERNKISVLEPKNLSCFPCQSSWLLPGHSFRDCFYDDLLCSESLNDESFIDSAKEILK